MLEKLTENWTLKLLSLVFALILWFFVMGERKLEVGYAIPLELKNIPARMMVANDVPGLIDVRVSGPRTLLMNLRPSDVSLAVDLGDLEPGVTTFRRLEERLNLPSGLKVTRVSPSFVDVKLERVREKTVPVRVVLAGAPAEGHRVAQVQASPSQVALAGAESELAEVNEVPTEPVGLEGAAESFTRMVPLSHRGKYTSLAEQAAVEVRVTVEPLPEAEAAGKEPGRNR